MKDLRKLLFEKLVIDNAVSLFNQKEFENTLKNDFGIDPDSKIGTHVIEWGKNHNVKKFEAYDDANFGFMLNGHAKFNKDKSKFAELKNTLLKQHKDKFTDENLTYYVVDDKIGMFIENDVGMIFVKLK